MENEIGGIPLGIKWIEEYLPREKPKRQRAIMILTILLTYFAYVSFNTARRPMTVIQIKGANGCRNQSETLCNYLLQTSNDPYMRYLGTVFLGSYVVSLHISGCVADYFNPRYYLSAGCLFGSFFCICLGLAYSWKIFQPGFFSMSLVMVSISQSTAWPVLLSCVTYWYSGPRRGLFYGLWNTHAYIGGIIGIYTASSVLGTKWYYASIVPGLLLAITAFLVFFFLVAHPSDDKSLHGSPSSMIELEPTDFPNEDYPHWLDSWRSLDYADAFRVPGVLQYSFCMFFARMVSYSCTFWLPLLHYHEALTPLSMINFWYILGGMVGGVACGVLKDIFKKSSLICVAFFLTVVPVIGMHVLWLQSKSPTMNLLNFLLGVVVEGPYILLNTSISADLGSHNIVRRGHRGIATVAAIIESAGAAGSALTSVIQRDILVRFGATYVFYLLMAMEVCAALCLASMAVRDWRQTYRRASDLSVMDYFFRRR